MLPMLLTSLDFFLFSQIISGQSHIYIPKFYTVFSNISSPSSSWGNVNEFVCKVMVTVTGTWTWRMVMVNRKGAWLPEGRKGQKGAGSWISCTVAQKASQMAHDYAFL